VFLVVFSARLVLVEHFSSPVPFWDDWVADGEIYLRVLHDNLDWPAMLAPVNDHCIAWHKLFSVICFQLNDLVWDPQPLMTFNAALAGLVPVFLLAACRGWNPVESGIGAAAALGIWATPMLWFNATWALQGVFCQVLLFCVAGISLVLRNRELRAGWWLGVLCLAAAPFALGSGVLGALAVGGVCALKAIQERNWLKGSRFTLGAVMLVCVINALLPRNLTESNKQRVGNLGELAASLWQNFSWPWSFPGQGHGLVGPMVEPGTNLYFFAPLLWLPAVLWFGFWLARGFRRREAGGTAELVLAALIAWAYAQIALLGLMRGEHGQPAAPRHYDIHAVGLLLNALVVARAAFVHWKLPRWEWLPAGAATLYFTIFLSGIAAQCGQAARDLQARREQIPRQIDNIRAYLRGGDPKDLADKPLFHVPLWNGQALALVLGNPVIRGILPPVLGDPVPLTPEGGNKNELILQDPLRVWAYRPDPDAASASWGLPEVRASYLRFQYAGPLQREESMPRIILAGAGKVSSAQLKPLGPAEKGNVYLRVYGRPRELVISASQAVTFMEPVPEGWLSYWARQLRGQALTFFTLGVFLGLGGAVLNRAQSEVDAKD
jgi:hypothetical protein